MKIAVLEDDVGVGVLFQEWLSAEKIEARTFKSGRELIAAVGRERFDFFVLDWNVPDISGIDVMAILRTQHDVRAPILFATGRDAEADVVAALNAGADDFMTKPIRRAELVARVTALMRRRGMLIADNAIKIGAHEIDPIQRVARYRGEVVSLTDTEFSLAHFLMRNHGALIPRATLYASALGKPEGTEQHSRTVDIHVGNLRRKFMLDDEFGLVIRSVYRLGYRLEEVALDTHLDEGDTN